MLNCKVQVGMKLMCIHFILMFSAFILFGWKEQSGWRSEIHQGYTFRYTEADRGNLIEYDSLIEQGVITVSVFFDTTFKKDFSVYFHPSRN